MIRLFLIFLLFTFSYAQRVRITPNDQREIEFVTLKNGISVVAVNDQQSQAGIIAYYQRGSFQNPKDFDGLAHFLEHMIFIKNKKDQEVDSIKNFVEKHHGMTNAFTDLNRTVYFFEIEPTHLEELIEKSSWTLRYPLFEDDYIQREKLAIDSEWQMGKNSTFRAGIDLMFAHMNSQHPISRFHIGNEASLSGHQKNDSLKAVESFYHDQYGANTLLIGVYGPFETAKLIEMVQKHFEDEQHQAIEIHQKKQEPLYNSEKEELTQLIKFIPKNEQYYTIIGIPINEGFKIKKDSLSYLQAYLYRTDIGSLYDYVTKNKLSSMIIANVLEMDDQALLLIGFEHTQVPAEKDVQKLLSITRDYLEQATAELDHNYLEILDNQVKQQWNISKIKTTSSNLIEYLNNLQLNRPEDIAIEGYLEVERYKDIILGQIRPDIMNTSNWLILQSVKNFPQDAVFDISRYDAPYIKSFIKIDNQKENFFQASSKPTHLIDDFSVIETIDMEKPQKVIDEKDCEAYVWTNQSFQQPIVNVMIQIEKSYDPLRSLTEQLALESFYAQSVDYQTKLGEAGFGMAVSNQSHAISISARGYRMNIEGLYKESLQYLKNTKLQEHFFNERKALRIQSIQNAIALGQQSVSNRLYELMDQEVSLERQLEFIQNLTLDTVQDSFDSLFIGGKARILVAGNIKLEDGKRISSDFYDQARTDSMIKVNSNIPSFRVKKAIKKSYPTTVNQTLLVKVVPFSYEAFKDIDLKTNLIFADSLLSGPAFEYLRTEKQLGYVVNFGSSINVQRERAFLTFTILSDKFNSLQIENEISNFVKKLDEIFEKISDEEFIKIKDSLISKIKTPPTSLDEKYIQFLQDFSEKNNNFNGKERLIASIEKKTFKQIQDFVKKNLNPNKNQYNITIAVEPAS